MALLTCQYVMLSKDTIKLVCTNQLMEEILNMILIQALYFIHMLQNGSNYQMVEFMLLVVDGGRVDYISARFG